MKLEWDRAKSEANLKKHGVFFEEAGELFASGDDYLEIFDDEHSDDEDRFIAIGAIVRGIVIVVYTERDGDVVRIISARWALKSEISAYRAHLEGRIR